MVRISGLMDPVLQEVGLIIKSTVMVFTSGLMGAGSRVNGKTTICMEGAFTTGLTVEFMRVNI